MNNELHEPPTVGQPATVSNAKQSGYGRAIIVAMVQQAIVLVLAALMLDGGRLLRAFAGALIASWAVTLLVMLRYPERPTPLGAVVVKYGFWLAIFLVLLLGPLVGLPRIFGL